MLLLLSVEAVTARIEARGGRAAAFTCDVTDAAAVEAMVAEVEERLGPVDVLDLTSRQQAELIAALSVLRKEHA